MKSKMDVLKGLRFGERIAEEELNDLERYFVATDQWNRVYSGEVDIIYDSKGAGKSAIYALIDKRQDDLFDRNILVRGAENIRGATAFSDLIPDPPPTERSFVDLWKTYFLVLCVSTLREYAVRDENAKSLITALEEADLLPQDGSLSSYFKQARALVWSYIFPEKESVEHTLAIEPTTGLPIVTRKTNYRAKELADQSRTDIPLDDLIGMASKALASSGYTLWILFDRLDVAFNDNPEIERNALRALFRMYNDFKGFENIKLKVFVRDDIWERISEGGFAEASHITKTTTINWSYENLVNLFIRRLLNNDTVCEYLETKIDEVAEDFEAQLAILERIFPDKVETGNNPETFRWMTNRITDAIGKPAPRELIHLSESIRQEQVGRLERGEEPPQAELLFDRAVFKPALKVVSQVRYDQTFIAENPSLKEFTDKLKAQKSEQNLESLAEIWGATNDVAASVADRLIKSGFFERREVNGSLSYWVPFIYRDALDLVQGKGFE